MTKECAILVDYRMHVSVALNVSLRNKVMSVYALRDSDIVTPEAQVCKTQARRGEK
jgi:hypothetical protein